MNPHPRCVATPEANREIAFRVDGVERLRWHFGSQYPRPFFYPFVGPSGKTLTRMGHPGAPDHDHHRSIWFAHNQVAGTDFWQDGHTRIAQKSWRCLQDGDDECLLAAELGWNDGHHPDILVEQELVAAVRPAPANGLFLELQATFRPTLGPLLFNKTNFGFLAVRMAKSLSARYGAGVLTGADGGRGEPALFGKPNRWMDYSGPSAPNVVEGVAYFDHPSNPGQPTKWHVRDDGWMGASVCRDAGHTATRDQPLTVRYLLFAHAGPANAQEFDRLHAAFAATKPYLVRKVAKGAVQWEAQRAG